MIARVFIIVIIFKVMLTFVLCIGPHTMSFPWKYRTISAGSEISGCRTVIAEPDEDGNGEVRICVITS